jgi:hypothetical protein
MLYFGIQARQSRLSATPPIDAGPSTHNLSTCYLSLPHAVYCQNSEGSGAALIDIWTTFSIPWTKFQCCRERPLKLEWSVSTKSLLIYWAPEVANDAIIPFNTKIIWDGSIRNAIWWAQPSLPANLSLHMHIASSHTISLGSYHWRCQFAQVPQINYWNWPNAPLHTDITILLALKWI